MRKVFIFLVAVLITASVFAQSPEKMSYQAVIRNASDILITNTKIGIQISILQGSASGTAVYVETQEPTTNANGLVSIEIGTGTVASGDFTTIDWANGPYFIKTETAVEAPLTTYTITGTSQLLSVPYALHAKTAKTVTGGITETDPVFEVWDKSTGISIIESQISDFGTYIVTETQNLDNVLTQGTSAGNKNITNLADPLNSLDAANKAYVDVLKQQIRNLEDVLISNGTFKLYDIDGNSYNVVKIGSQVWMAENLKTTKFNDGTLIPNVTDKTAWSTLTTPAYCWQNNNEATNKIIYGALYNWYTVSTEKLCPIGWHVPSDIEWTELTTFLGGGNVAGGKLKESGTSHWQSPNTGADNSSGFTALPGGFRYYHGGFNNLTTYGFWWSSTENGNAWYRHMYYLDNDVIRSTGHGVKTYGQSIRCIRD